jgi:hypothetical protein
MNTHNFHKNLQRTSSEKRRKKKSEILFLPSKRMNACLMLFTSHNMFCCILFMPWNTTAWKSHTRRGRLHDVLSSVMHFLKKESEVPVRTWRAHPERRLNTLSHPLRTFLSHSNGIPCQKMVRQMNHGILLLMSSSVHLIRHKPRRPKRLLSFLVHGFKSPVRRGRNRNQWHVYTDPQNHLRQHQT